MLVTWLSEGGTVLTPSSQEAEAQRCKVTCHRPLSGSTTKPGLMPRATHMPQKAWLLATMGTLSGTMGALSTTMGHLSSWRLTGPGCLNKDNAETVPGCALPLTQERDSASLSLWVPLADPNRLLAPGAPSRGAWRREVTQASLVQCANVAAGEEGRPPS